MELDFQHLELLVCYVLGLLFDADNKTMRYVDNGVISKVYNMANTVDGDSYYFFVGGDAGSYEIDVNFGQKPSSMHHLMVSNTE